jgi:hypothetical protein
MKLDYVVSQQNQKNDAKNINPQRSMLLSKQKTDRRKGERERVWWWWCSIACSVARIRCTSWTVASFFLRNGAYGHPKQSWLAWRHWKPHFPLRETLRYSEINKMQVLVYYCTFYSMREHRHPVDINIY